MKKILLSLLLILVSIPVLRAQKVIVSGTVADADTHESLPSAAVVLLRPDSVQAVGVATGLKGAFTLPAVKPGSYILKVSFVGYRTHYRNLTLTKAQTKEEVKLGTIGLASDAVLMQSAEVTARAAQVEMKADTFVYNSSAYRLPEGSALEELVRKLPGAEVDENGTIKINGKEVKKIMVDGKEFFDNDTKMAMKNLPTKMVENIKAYDRQSDYTRITGIDDGEEETVLDLTVKKGMKKGWLINSDVGYGTEERYIGKAMVNRFTDRLQFTTVGSTNNINDRGFPGGGFGRMGGGSGLVDSKMAGINIVWENGKKEREAGRLELGGNIRYNHNSNDSESKTNSQTFLGGEGNNSFSNSRRKSISSNTNVRGNFRLEWSPDSMTRINFRPNFSYSENYGWSASNSVTFNEDPYLKYTDPLYQYRNDLTDPSLVNSNDRDAKNDGNSRSVDGRLQLNRRLNSKGRNVDLSFSGGYSSSDNTSFSISNVHYYRETDPNRKKSYTNQYNVNPSKSHNLRAGASYNEPLFEGANLQFRYNYRYSYSDSDRSMYSLDSLVSKGLVSEGDLYLGYIPGMDWLELCKNQRNSQYATYKEHEHEAQMMFRYKKGEFQLNAGVSFQPQTTHMDYLKDRLDTTVTRHVFNWAPRFDVRYKFSKVSQIRFRYNGRSSQPSMTNLLDITDDSDPLNVSRGNPGLKPAWTNRANLFYNGGIPDKQMSWMVHAEGSMTQNSISTAVTYDEQTGKRTSRPENINGNWNARGSFMFNTALGAKKYFNVHTFTHWGYTNDVGYISSSGRQASAFPQKATTKKTSVGERLRFNFRNDLLELGINGSINYDHARNDLQPNGNLDTYNFSYGGNAIINFPWNMSLSTDLGMDSRRGYDDASMNTNELIWNAQLSQSFLKENAATISVQWYDILRERSNISRSISATGRSDTWNNAIHNYVMVHFIYRLNLFGSREARAGMGGPRDGFGPSGGRRGPGGGGFGPPPHRM